MAERYNFKYLPLVGKLPGKSMVEQTETAINELASVVYDNVGHVGNLAEEVQTANANASNALDKATEALETSGRVYIKQIAAVDVNDYYDSELYYINNDGSTNIPVRDRGFLEVKTNDDKTACEQVFIADSTGTPYYRHGRITEQTLGEETTYVVTWSSWYRVATTKYVQGELTNYLPLSGGTVTGGLTVEGTITGNLAGNADTATNATNATNDANGNPIAGTYLPLSGGTMTGSIYYKGANDRSFGFDLTDNYTSMDIGWDWTNRDGAGVSLRSADDTSSTEGSFSIYAMDGHDDAELKGCPDGSLTWDGKEVERINASGSNCIRYESGLQICWGSVLATSDGAQQTFGKPFIYDPWVVVSAKGYYAGSGHKDESSTGFKATTDQSSGAWVTWIAIGEWK